MMGVGSLGAVVIGSNSAGAKPVAAEAGTFNLGGKSIRFVDLTHELTSEFNFSSTSPRIAMDPIVGSGLASGMNLNRLLLVEHAGTHIDAPRHFSNDGKSLGEVPLSDLIAPLAVIDLRARAVAYPDVALMPDDILLWERRHGPLPAGCCVVIHTGSDPIARIAGMRAADSGLATLSRASPGFSLEAVKMLATSRDVKGIGLDATNIDRGSNTPAYPVHQYWLRSGRWGLEGLTNLDAVPPVGAVLMVGAAPIDGATGMPIRALALF